MSQRDDEMSTGKRRPLDTTPMKTSGFDYKALCRSPPNKWTNEQRITLCTLVQFYELNGLETTLIFNSLFAKELPSSKGLSRAALASMRYKLEQEHFQDSGSWTTIRRTIEAEAAILGIHLLPKDPLNETANLKTMSRRTKNNLGLTSESPDSPSKGEASDEVDWLSDSDDTLLGDDSDPVTPCKLRGRPPPERSLEIPGLMTSCPYKSFPGKGAQIWKGTPRIVFRA